MSFDNHANFGTSTVATAPSPADSGTSLTVASGASFPSAPFNCTVWDGSDITTAEIIRVTDKGTGANWTITRAQESTSARSIVAGDVVANTITKKVITDIESQVSTALGLINVSTSSPTALTNSTGALLWVKLSAIPSGVFRGLWTWDGTDWVAIIEL